jgi:hypothetical protein
VFHMNVAKVDWNVAYVAMVVYVLYMLQWLYMYVASFCS